MDMENLDMDIFRIKTMLMLHEGLKLEPYICPGGFLTIGVGRNLDTVGISDEEAKHPGIGSKNPKRITIEGAKYLLNNDISRVIAALSKDPVFDALNRPRKAVLVDMGFNLGIEGLYRFKKMWKALKDGDYNEAANQMKNSKWYSQVGRRSSRLERMMRSGDWLDV